MRPNDVDDSKAACGADMSCREAARHNHRKRTNEHAAK